MLAEAGPFAHVALEIPPMSWESFCRVVSTPHLLSCVYGENADRAALRRAGQGRKESNMSDPANRDGAAPGSGLAGTWPICAAGAAGAFTLAIGDLFREDLSRLARISEVLVTLGLPGPRGLLFPLLLVVGLGGMIAWVHRPRVTSDAFVWGLSVFAVLGTAAPAGTYGPLEEPGLPDGTARSDTLEPAAAASRTLAPANPLAAAKGPARASIRVLGYEGSPAALVTVRDLATKQIIARARVTGRTVVIEQASGRYLVDFEAQGYRRIQFRLTLDGDASYRLKATRSSVPLAIQRLTAPEKVVLMRDPGAGGRASGIEQLALAS